MWWPQKWRWKNKVQTWCKLTGSSLKFNGWLTWKFNPWIPWDSGFGKPSIFRFQPLFNFGVCVPTLKLTASLHLMPDATSERKGSSEPTINFQVRAFNFREEPPIRFDMGLKAWDCSPTEWRQSRISSKRWSQVGGWAVPKRTVKPQACAKTMVRLGPENHSWISWIVSKFYIMNGGSKPEFDFPSAPPPRVRSQNVTL